MPEKAAQPYKVGYVAIVGRPNVGKSTLLNALVEQKVAIVSPKPQTTQSQIVAYYEDERGQIFFLDTPGFFSGKRGTPRHTSIIKNSIEEADVIVYVVDHTRAFGEEDERVWRLVSESEKPKILALNKMDKKHPDYTEQYLALMEDEVQAMVPLSALQQKHLKALRSEMYTFLPEGKRDESVDLMPIPLLSQTSTEYVAEIIREKIFLLTGQEVPYQAKVKVDEIVENEEKNRLHVRGEVLVSHKRYKPILIGKNGQKIKEISEAAKKELEIASGKEVFIRLQVEVE